MVQIHLILSFWIPGRKLLTILTVIPVTLIQRTQQLWSILCPRARILKTQIALIQRIQIRSKSSALMRIQW